MSDHQINFTGWSLFVMSATGFCTVGLRHFRAMFGPSFSMAACLTNLIPAFREPQQ